MLAWKPVSNDTFKLNNIYRHLYGSVAAIQRSVSLTFFKNEYLLQFPTFSPRSLFQFFVFFVSKLTIKFSIIYDHAEIKDCRHKQRSAKALSSAGVPIGKQLGKKNGSVPRALYFSLYHVSTRPPRVFAQACSQGCRRPGSVEEPETPRCARCRHGDFCERFSLERTH